MNLDELRQSLATIADEAHDDTTRTDRLDAVDEKVNTQRRRTVLATCAVAAVVVAAVAVAPLVLDRSDETAPTDGSPRLRYDTPLPTVEDNGVWFYESPAKDRLIGHAVTDPGQQSATFTLTPDSTHLSYAFECLAPAGERLPGVEFRVNGHWESGGRCRPRTGTEPLLPTFRPTPAGWRDVGVSTGKPFEVTLRIKPQGLDLPGAAQVQLAGGVYRDSEDTVGQDGVVLDRQRVSAGHTYEFRGFTSAPAPNSSRTTTLSIDTAGLDADLVAVFGVRGRAAVSFWGTLEGSRLAGSAGSGWLATDGISNDGAVDLTLRTRGSGPDDALRYLAVFERID